MNKLNVVYVMVLGLVGVSIIGLSGITPANVVTLLQENLPRPQVTQADFLRILPALLGFGDRINFDAPIEEFIALLTKLGVIPRDLAIDPAAPVTKGWASILKVKALNIRPTFIEWIQMQIFGLTPELALRMAQRAGVMAPGAADDVETGLEFACDALATASLARIQPLPGAKTWLIVDVIQAITRYIVDAGTCAPIIPGLVPVPTS